MDSNEDDDLFFDAFDDLEFHDCICTTTESDANATSSVSSPSSSPTTTLHHRRSLSRRRGESEQSQSSLESIITRIEDSKEKRHKRFRKLKEHEKTTESARCRVDSGRFSSTTSESTVSGAANGDRADDSVVRLGEPDSSGLLVALAELVIKAIGFQFHLLISFVKFPISVLYCCYVFIFDPFRAIKNCKECMLHKLFYLWDTVFSRVSPMLYQWFQEQQTVGKVLLRFGWGLFWSIYVCIVLCGMLVMAILISGFCMRYLIEEPTQIKEVLNFDFTKSSPVAYVPIISCHDVDCGISCKGIDRVGKSNALRVIPHNHKLQAKVSMSLPESEYNRNLGIFQIRVDLLSADGKTLASLRHPCMLLFRSEPIRLLSTFIKAVPLLAGYVTESQNLNVKIRGFAERAIPTSCVKVTIEQRAEFRPGAGIPEIYNAFITLESELPLLKRILWYWKKTLFIWFTMMTFMTEFLFMLLCCRPIIIPITRTTTNSANNNPAESSF